MQILDGALGTQLGLRGVALEPPAWSAEAIRNAPKTLAQVHADYAAAGATLHTANTFRTQRPVLGSTWRDDLHAAVRIARASIGRDDRVLGSIAPLADCYRPDLSPGDAAYAEHAEVAHALVDAGADILLCETFAHEAEALAAVRAAVDARRPVWLAMTAGPRGDLLEPKDFARIGERAMRLGAGRLLVNCIAATRTAPFVDALASVGAPIGVYANAGSPDEGLGWDAPAEEAARRYADLAERWVDLGATVVGGCCGTGPQHIRTLAARWGSGVGGVLQV